MNRSVTVISPAVRMATQNAATPMADAAAGRVTRISTCRGEPSNAACSSNSGSTNRKPTPTINTTQGIAAAVWIQTTARNPSSQTAPPERECMPPLEPKAGLPRGGLKIERNEKHHGQKPDANSPARHVRPRQQPRQRRPQRHAYRAHRRRERKCIQQKCPGSNVHFWSAAIHRRFTISVAPQRNVGCEFQLFRPKAAMNRRTPK